MTNGCDLPILTILWSSVVSVGPSRLLLSSLFPNPLILMKNRSWNRVSDSSLVEVEQHQWIFSKLRHDPRILLVLVEDLAISSWGTTLAEITGL